MNEKRKTHGAMTIHQIFEIDAKIGDLYKNGEPGVVAERSVGTAIAKLMARRMANGGKAHIGDGAHVQQLMQCGFAKTTAKRIVKKARNLATDLPPMPDPKGTPPAPQETSRPSPKEKVADSRQNVPSVPRPDSNLPAAPIPESDLTDYVKALPETLPLPICTIARPEVQSTVKQVNLQNLHNELFSPGTDRFIKQLRYQAPVTSNNPFGLYQLAAPHREKIRYGAIWDAIGNNDIPPLWFPAILPYLAEEGLLEYYKVEPDLVAELEQARQTYISDGVLQAYDRKSTFIPRTKPPHAPDGYVCT